MGHSCWMAKIFYFLKMFILSNQFGAMKKSDLEEICIFTVTVYIQIWFTAPLALCTLNNDFPLIQDLIKYNEPIKKFKIFTSTVWNIIKKNDETGSVFNQK